MPTHGLRGEAYLLLHTLRRSTLPRHYRQFLADDRARRYPDTGSLLADTLEHAVRTVPHYESVVPVEAIRSDPFGALSAFPILTRNAVRESGDGLLSCDGDQRHWQENTSGGSTGEPVRLLQDPDHLALTVAIRNVYSTWAGGGLGSPELYIWGSEEDILKGSASLRIRLADRLLRRSFLNAFQLRDEAIQKIVREVREGPPRLVIAYAQAGYEVARHIRRHGLSVPAQKGFIATAGTLYPFMREELESVFGCPVFNRYGSRETGDMAGDCEERSGLHVLPWSCHIEIVDKGGEPVAPGEEGDIVVTSFTNKAMPLIRYRIGDRARTTPGPVFCPCGRRTQMLKSVTGRTVDMFIGSDGRMVDGEYFTHLLYFRPWVRQFQVRQRARDEVVYRVTTQYDIPEADAREIVAKTRAVLGTDCQVSFEEVDLVEPSESGKLRYTMREF